MGDQAHYFDIGTVIGAIIWYSAYFAISASLLYVALRADAGGPIRTVIPFAIQALFCVYGLFRAIILGYLTTTYMPTGFVSLLLYASGLVFFFAIVLKGKVEPKVGLLLAVVYCLGSLVLSLVTLDFFAGSYSNSYGDWFSFKVGRWLCSSALWLGTAFLVKYQQERQRLRVDR